MGKNIAIVTEESGAKRIPGVSPWKRKSGRGMDLSKHTLILDTLKRHNIQTFPSDDLANEKRYRKALRKFIIPSIEMYAGMFDEVKVFYSVLSREANVKLYIISGRYGLIEADKEIIPYGFYMATVEEIIRIYKKHEIFEKTKNIINNNHYVILVLPKIHLEALFSKDHSLIGSLRNNRKLVIVSAKSIGEEIKLKAEKRRIKVIFFPRVGVARLGKDNREKIIEIIKAQA